jgi:hypothetical protein
VALDLPEDAFPTGVAPLQQRLMWLLDLVPLRQLVSGPFG